MTALDVISQHFGFFADSFFAQVRAATAERIPLKQQL
jgi:hypothetical protein